MKNKYLILVFLLQIGTIYSQNLFQVHYESSSDVYFPKIALTNNSGHLIFYMGKTSSFGDTDFSLAMINSSGEIEWNKHFGNSNRDLIRGILPYGSNFLTYGWLNQYGYIDDIYLATIDANGNLISQKSWGVSGDDEVQTVVNINDNRFAMAGNSLSNVINGGTELFLTLFNSDLNLESVHLYSTSEDDVPRKIIQSNNSDLYITGFIRSNGNHSGFLTRINMNGDLIWAKRINQPSVFWDVIQLSDYNFICVGETRSSTNPEAFLTKFDSTGNVIWAKTYSYGSNTISKVYQIKKSHGENYVVLGSTTGTESGSYDIFLMNIDINGNFISGYTYGGNSDEDWPNLAYSTADSGYSIIAETKSFGADNLDLFFINTDDLGRSCCSRPIDNVAIQNLNETAQTVNYSTLTVSFQEQSHPINSGPLNFDEELLCYKPVQILGRDTIFCDDSSNEKYTIDIDFLLDLEWIVPPTASIINNINDTTVFIDFAMQSGMIYLLSSCSDTLDSLYVYVEQSINLSLGNDTLVCGGQAFYLNAGDGFDSYLWQDGSTNSTLLVTQTGNYWVQVENSCGFTTDTIHINFSSSFDINIGNDTSFCYGQSIKLSPGSEYYSYYWQDGSTDSLLFAGSSGYFWVQVTDSLGCTAIDSIYIDAFMDFGFSLGPDTSVICDGDYIFLHGPEGYESYEWQDGSGYLDFLADTNGIYWLEVTDENDCAARDSILLIVNKVPDDFLGNDTVMCEGDYFDIHAPSFYDKYLWQDGSTDSVFIAWQTGNYWVYVEDSIGCNGIDTISLSTFQPPILNHSNDTLICPDDSLLLSPGGGMLYYNWNTGSTDSSIFVSTKDNYWVEMGTNCGLFVDSIFIDIYSNPLFSLGPDTNICEGENIRLSAGTGFSSYLWSNGSEDSILIVVEKGIYSVMVEDFTCLISDTISINDCTLLWVPNVFTPNGDGYNDDFFAVSESVQEFKMIIFNRWGRVLKTLNNIEEKWDGSYNGNPCPDAVYYWKAEFNETNRESNKVLKVLQGSVTIIRAK